MSLEQFERGGSLSGDHVRSGEGMDQRRAGFAADAIGRFVARGERRRAEMQRRAVSPDRGDLRCDRVFGNHDMRRNAARLRRERECGAMIAGRMRDHAARASSSLSDHTALHAPRNLNAPARWKFSHLNASVRVGQFIDAARAQHRRALRVRRNALAACTMDSAGVRGNRWRSCRQCYAICDGPDSRAKDCIGTRFAAIATIAV